MLIYVRRCLRSWQVSPAPSWFPFRRFRLLFFVAAVDISTHWSASDSSRRENHTDLSVSVDLTGFYRVFFSWNGHHKWPQQDSGLGSGPNKNEKMLTLERIDKIRYQQEQTRKKNNWKSIRLSRGEQKKNSVKTSRPVHENSVNQSTFSVCYLIFSRSVSVGKYFLHFHFFP